jgi:hypothetical protein
MPILIFVFATQKIDHMTANLPDELCLADCTRSPSNEDGRGIRSDVCRANWRHPAFDDKSIRISRWRIH